jgi:hypothetical protein
MGGVACYTAHAMVWTPPRGEIANWLAQSNTTNSNGKEGAKSIEYAIPRSQRGRVRISSITASRIDSADEINCTTIAGARHIGSGDFETAMQMAEDKDFANKNCRIASINLTEIRQDIKSNLEAKDGLATTKASQGIDCIRDHRHFQVKNGSNNADVDLELRYFNDTCLDKTAIVFGDFEHLSIIDDRGAADNWTYTAEARAMSDFETAATKSIRDDKDYLIFHDSDCTGELGRYKGVTCCQEAYWQETNYEEVIKIDEFGSPTRPDNALPAGEIRRPWNQDPTTPMDPRLPRSAPRFSEKSWELPTDPRLTPTGRGNSSTSRNSR